VFPLEKGGWAAALVFFFNEYIDIYAILDSEHFYILNEKSEAGFNLIGESVNKINKVIN